MDARALSTFERIDQAELRFCRILNRSSRLSPICLLFRWISKLGDGWFWYAWIAFLPLTHAANGRAVAVQLIVTGVVGVVLYKLIKNSAVRERPFITHSSINCQTAPLDRYSFPSGHTMHAVAFSWMILNAYPQYGVVLAISTGLIALSRIVLGLHYPSDVFAGGILGGLLASVSGLIAAGFLTD